MVGSAIRIDAGRNAPAPLIATSRAPNPSEGRVMRLLPTIVVSALFLLPAACLSARLFLPHLTTFYCPLSLRREWATSNAHFTCQRPARNRGRRRGSAGSSPLLPPFGPPASTAQLTNCRTPRHHTVHFHLDPRSGYGPLPPFFEIIGNRRHLRRRDPKMTARCLATNSNALDVAARAESLPPLATQPPPSALRGGSIMRGPEMP